MSEEQKEIITQKVLTRSDTDLIKVAFANQQPFLAQNMAAIQQAVSLHQEIMRTFDFSAFTQAIAEAQRTLAEFHQRISVFTLAPKREVYIPTREKPREVIIVKEMSEQQEDRIVDKLYAKIQTRDVLKSETLLLGTSNRIIALPENARWESVTVSFESPQEITVHFKNDFIGRFGYEELGFYRKSTTLKRPNMAWGLFLILAVSMKGRNSTIEHLLRGGRFKKEVSIHTTRTALSKQLKEAFGISEDPFYSYKEEGCYKTKFKLVPLPEMRHDELVMQSGSHDLRETEYVSH